MGGLGGALGLCKEKIWTVGCEGLWWGPDDEVKVALGTEITGNGKIFFFF